LFCLAGLTFPACGGDDAPSTDGGTGPRYHLEVLDPPGDQIGLAFLAAAELRVRLSDRDGLPVRRHGVEFTIDGETDAAGSTLSTTALPTDDGGVAAVQVQAGGGRANFRVHASAIDAQPATFYVAVSDLGFARLTVTPRHQGFRPPPSFAAIDVRLYPGGQCALLDPTDPPASVYPPRTATAFDEAVTFQAVAGQEPHTLLGAGKSQAGAVLAAGCLELQGDQVRAGDLYFELPVTDRPATLAEYRISTTLDTRSLASAALPALQPWRLASCPSGPAQVLLDFSLARLPMGATRDALMAARTAPDPLGCRSGGLDGSLNPVITAAGAFVQVADAFPRSLESLSLTTRLRADGTHARHRLEGLSVDLGNGSIYTEDALASARPVVEAFGVPVVVMPSYALIEEHGLTLRPAWIFRAALEEGFLAPAGLPDLAGLAAALIASASTGSGATGCAAVSESACASSGLAPDCLTTACQAAVPDLAAALAAPFATMDAPGLDLVWQGQATVLDEDLDLIVEALTTGLWSGEIVLASGMTVGVTGGFSGEP
jgi:hypothetical protein